MNLQIFLRQWFRRPVLPGVVCGFALAASASAGPPTARDGPVVAIRSSDGLQFDAKDTPSASPPPTIRVAEQARQPDVLLLTKATPSRNGPDAGSLICYFAQGESGLRRSISVDQGRSWGAADAVVIRGWPKEFEGIAAGAPAAVQLDDARVRLYFTAAKSGAVQPVPLAPRPGRTFPSPGESQPARLRPDSAPVRVYSAISNDGLQFAFEDGFRFELGDLSDPDVVRLPDLKTGEADDRKIGPWLLIFTRDDSTLLATSRDGLTFARDETFVIPSLRRAGTALVAADVRRVRIYGQDQTGIVSSVFDPASGDIKPDSGVRRSGDAQDPAACPTGDGGTLLVLVQKTTDKPDRLPTPDPLDPGRPRPKQPLDPRYPPTHPAPKPEPEPK